MGCASMPSTRRALLQSGSLELPGLGPAQDLPLGRHSLQDASVIAVAAAGFTPCADPEQGAVLVVPVGCALGPKALEAAWEAGQQAGRDGRIVLSGAIGEMLRMSSLAGEGLVYLHGASPSPLGERMREAKEICLDPQEKPLGELVPGGEALMVSDRLILPVRSWIGLLWANLLLLPPTLWLELGGEGLGAAWAVVRAFFRSGPRRIPQGLSRGGEVHPDAIVEASLLLPGAKVEAGAVVRGSILGPGARVEPLALVEGSVLGPQAVVQRQAMLKFGVLGSGASLGGVLQLGVLGPQAAFKRGSTGMDQRLDGSPVRVEVGGQIVPAPMGMAGICVGEGTTVGSGVWVAPGRRIPAGVVVLGGNVLARPDSPEGHQGPLVVRDGRLEAP